MYDLIVIGGGPAGTSTAITAARKSARVLLLERGGFPRHKVCGEFVSSESLNLLARLLHLPKANFLREAVRIAEARLFLDGRTLLAPIKPAAASLARLDLDKALWDSAQACGVEASQRVVVQNIERQAVFVVTTSGGNCASRAVVNASGRWSNLRQASNGQAEAKWIGLKAHFAEHSPAPSVDLYFFDGGYCGVQPVLLRTDSRQPRINACAMVRADLASTLAEVFDLHPALRERAVHWQPLIDPVSVAPLLFGKPRPVHDGVLMVGDAAGFVDPFVGDGISLALRSGAMAAECLLPFLSGTVSLENAARRYAEEYERKLAPVFRSSSKIRRMLRWPRVARAPIVSLLSNFPATTGYLVRSTR